MSNNKYDEVEKKIDNLDILIRGDGGNKRGLEIRMALVEKDIGLIKWVSIVGAGAVIVNLIQQIIQQLFHHAP